MDLRPWWHLPCTGMGLGEAVPSIGSCVAGLLFGTAWLLWIDGVAFAATEYGEAVNGAYWVPGTLQTIGLIMVNVINWGLLTDDSMMDDGAVVMVTPRPMLDLDRYAEQLRARTRNLLGVLRRAQVRLDTFRVRDKGSG